MTCCHHPTTSHPFMAPQQFGTSRDIPDEMAASPVTRIKVLAGSSTWRYESGIEGTERKRKDQGRKQCGYKLAWLAGGRTAPSGAMVQNSVVSRGVSAWRRPCFFRPVAVFLSALSLWPPTFSLYRRFPLPVCIVPARYCKRWRCVYSMVTLN